MKKQNGIVCPTFNDYLLLEIYQLRFIAAWEQRYIKTIPASQLNIINSLEENY